MPEKPAEYTILKRKNFREFTFVNGPVYFGGACRDMDSSHGNSGYA
jgi:hypothetical protein